MYMTVLDPALQSWGRRRCDRRRKLIPLGTTLSARVIGSERKIPTRTSDFITISGIRLKNSPCYKNPPLFSRYLRFSLLGQVEAIRIPPPLVFQVSETRGELLVLIPLIGVP